MSVYDSTVRARFSIPHRVAKGELLSLPQVMLNEVCPALFLLRCLCLDLISLVLRGVRAGSAGEDCPSRLLDERRRSVQIFVMWSE